MVSAVGGLVELVDLVLPVRCVGCARAAGPLCVRCAPHAEDLRPVRVRPMDRPGGGAPEVCVAAASYAGALRSALVAYKERGHRALARPLGALLAAAVAEVATGVDCRPLVLVPVPSAPAAIRSRGDDHMLRLARAAARVLRRSGVETLVVAALRMLRVPADSVGLSAAQRSVNIADAFGLSARTRRLPAHCALVVVDDVVTTGATLDEAYRTALQAGVPVLGAATVAATNRRRR